MVWGKVGPVCKMFMLLLSWDSTFSPVSLLSVWWWITAITSAFYPESRDGYAGVSQKGYHHRAPRGGSAALQGLSLPAPQGRGRRGHREPGEGIWKLEYVSLYGGQFNGRSEKGEIQMPRLHLFCFQGLTECLQGKDHKPESKYTPTSLLDWPFTLRIVHTSTTVSNTNALSV